MYRSTLSKLAAGLLLLCILATGCGTAATPAPAAALPAQISVAAVEDLTGPNAVYGTSIKMGIDLAARQINSQKFLGAGVSFNVNYTDTASNTDQVVSAFKKLLVADTNTTAIIGPTLSSEAVAADPLAQQAGVPVVASSNTAGGITTIGSYIFRTSLPESAVVPNTVSVVSKALGLKKVAIIYGSDDTFTTSSEQIFKDSFTKAGVQVLPEQTFV